jgi:hypothetical protein
MLKGKLAAREGIGLHEQRVRLGERVRACIPRAEMGKRACQLDEGVNEAQPVIDASIQRSGALHGRLRARRRLIDKPAELAREQRLFGKRRIRIDVRCCHFQPSRPRHRHCKRSPGPGRRCSLRPSR